MFFIPEHWWQSFKPIICYSFTPNISCKYFMKQNLSQDLPVDNPWLTLTKTPTLEKDWGNKPMHITTCHWVFKIQSPSNFVTNVQNVGGGWLGMKDRKVACKLSLIITLTRFIATWTSLYLFKEHGANTFPSHIRVTVKPQAPCIQTTQLFPTTNVFQVVYMNFTTKKPLACVIMAWLLQFPCCIIYRMHWLRIKPGSYSAFWLRWFIVHPMECLQHACVLHHLL